jgi:hypothetical protein
MLQRRWLRWTLVVAGWTSAGLFFASQTYLAYKYSGGQAHLRIILRLSLADWYLWGLLAPGIIWLGRRFPLERGHWARSTGIHLIAGVGVALLKWWLDNLFRHYVLGLPSATSLVYVFHGNLLTYSILIAGTQGYLYYERYRQGELRSALLSAQLAQAQLQALRMQLHPHFLFNTLNSIAALIHKDPDAADRMTARLSDLLRLTLDNIGPGSSACARAGISGALLGNRENAIFRPFGGPDRGRYRNTRRQDSLPYSATAGGECDPPWDCGSLLAGLRHRACRPEWRYARPRG